MISVLMATTLLYFGLINDLNWTKLYFIHPIYIFYITYTENDSAINQEVVCVYFLARSHNSSLWVMWWLMPGKVLRLIKKQSRKNSPIIPTFIHLRDWTNDTEHVRFRGAVGSVVLETTFWRSQFHLGIKRILSCLGLGHRRLTEDF